MLSLEQCNQCILIIFGDCPLRKNLIIFGDFPLRKNLFLGKPFSNHFVANSTGILTPIFTPWLSIKDCDDPLNSWEASSWFSLLVRNHPDKCHVIRSNSILLIIISIFLALLTAMENKMKSVTLKNNILGSTGVIHLCSKTKPSSMNGIPWQNDHYILRDI